MDNRLSCSEIDILKKMTAIIRIIVVILFVKVFFNLKHLLFEHSQFLCL